MKRKFKLLKPLQQDAAIYKIGCNKIDKIYIGESINVSARIAKHFAQLRHNNHRNPILQNIFNKYGELEMWIDIIEYCNGKDKQYLRKQEEYYQSICSNHMNFDRNHNTIVNVLTDEQKFANKKQLDDIRGRALQNWKRKLIIYDIINQNKILVNSIDEAEQYIEQKHIYQNIKKKQYIPYKGYVCFIPEEFDISKIITISNSKSYNSHRGIFNLINIFTGEIKRFSSKTQCGYYLFRSKNDKLLNIYFNTIDENGWTLCDDFSDLSKINFIFYRTNKSIKKLSIIDYENSLLNYTTYIQLAKKFKVNRHYIPILLSIKNIDERLFEIQNIKRLISEAAWLKSI